MDAFERDAKKAAARRVADLLQSPDQLQTVHQIKHNILQKKVALESQIKAVVQTQLEDAKDAISKLHESNELIDTICRDFKNVDNLCVDCKTLINNSDYDMIQKINQARTNVQITHKEIHRMLSIPHKVKEVENLFSDDINLLTIHTELRNLERMRSEAFLKAADKMEELRVLELAFSDVGRLAILFEQSLFRLARDCIKLAQTRPEVLVKVLQVIERDGKHDEALKEQLEQQGLDPDDEVNSKSFRRYKEQFFQQLRDQIMQRFDEVFRESSSISSILPNAQTIIDDLIVVLDEVVPCFPPHYQVFEFFAKEYHLRFNTLFLHQANTPGAVTPKEIIDLVAWIKEGYEPQLARLGIVDPQPPLLETIEPLYEHYKTHIKGLLNNWVKEIVAQDRESQPEEIDELLYTLAPSLLFEGINAQLNTAKKTNDSKFVYSVLQECCNALLVFQQNLLDMINNEWQNLYLEYIEALVNNNSKCYDIVEELEVSMSTLLPEPYRSNLSSFFEPVTEGFVSVSKRAMLALADIISRDLVEPLQKMFTKEWYTSESSIITGVVIPLVKEWFDDMERGIMESYFRKLALETLERICNSYVEQLFTGRKTLDKYTVERMLEDETQLKTFFTNYLRETQVDARLQIISDLRELLDAEPEMIGLYFHSLLKNHPDVSMSNIEQLLSMRYDLSRSQIAESLASCKKIMDQQHIDQENIPAGIFTKLNKKR